MTGTLFEVLPNSATTSTPSETALRSTTGGEDRVYEALHHLPVSTMNLLVLSYRHSPDTWLQQWREHGGTVPQEFGFIRCGATTRSTASSEQHRETGRFPSRVEVVPDPADVSTLKEYIRAYFNKWTGNGQQTVIYLDSLAPVLQSLGLDATYKFLHILTGRIKSINGYGYYLMRPEADNPELDNLLRDLVDEWIELSETAICR